MKLRLRCFETKQTLKIDVPSSSCTLQQLKHRISETFPLSSSSSNSIHLSLNCKDELESNSPSENTLQSLGITSGDLLFFTFKPNGFSISSQTQIPKSQPTQDSNLLMKSDSQIGKKTDGANELDTHEMKTQIPNCPPDSNPDPFMKLDTQFSKKTDGVNELDTHEMKTQMPTSQPDPIADPLMNLDPQMEDFMEVDNGDYRKSFSVPGFLRNVFMEELSDDGGCDHKLLAVAVHAVFVESGFVLRDPFSCTELSGCQFSRMTLFYTLPEIFDIVKSGDCKAVNNTVELKFQSLGKFVIAYGSLSGGVNSSRRVTLNEDHLVPFLNVVWANCGLREDVTGGEGGFGTNPEREVFQFWRSVKDRLVLPLLIDLCEQAGLELPPCFTRLPTDLKLKILELLPGVDVAKASCLSSELQYLASSDDLWKKKFVEQFGDARTSVEGGHWKEKFVKYWESRKRRKLIARRRGPLRFLATNPFVGPWRPHIIGGDYDLLPRQFDNTGNPLGRPLPLRSSPLPSHVPCCHLGGHSDSFA